MTETRKQPTDVNQQDEEKFPRIIFGERHNDSTCSEILTKLIHKLEKLGYTHFFEERVESESLEVVLEYIDRQEAEHTKYEREFKTYGLEFSKENAFEFYNNYLRKSSLPWTSYDVFYYKIYCLITYMHSLLAQRSLLLGIKKSSITYKPIDIIPQVKGFHSRLEEKKLEMAARDEAMAKAYLQTSTPVFGRIGIDHFIGIESYLISNLGVPRVTESFCLFHVYKEQSDNLEKLPPSVIRIDANLKTEEEIIEEVIRIINSKRIIFRRHNLEQKNEERLPPASKNQSIMNKLQNPLFVKSKIRKKYYNRLLHCGLFEKSTDKKGKQPSYPTQNFSPAVKKG